MKTKQKRLHKVDCYSCRNEIEYDLNEIEAERSKYNFARIVEHPENPRSYYIRCTECDTFNRVRH